MIEQEAKDWYDMKSFNLSKEEKDYQEKLKILPNENLIILLLADLLDAQGVPKTKRRNCIRLVEAHRRNHK